MTFFVWFKDAAIRAVRTFAQVAAGFITYEGLPTLSLTEVNWTQVLSVAAVAAIYSLLMSIAGLPETKMKLEAGLDK